MFKSIQTYSSVSKRFQKSNRWQSGNIDKMCASKITEIRLTNLFFLIEYEIDVLENLKWRFKHFTIQLTESPLSIQRKHPIDY